jgi:nitrogen regulatory protein PII
LPKIKVECAVDSKLAESVIETIRETCSSGRIGDGKIFTMDLSDAMRIRTGETGLSAL